MGEKSVSAATNSLLVDIGNTRIKYAIADAHGDFQVVRYCQSVADLSYCIASVQQVLVANVGQASVVDALKGLAGGLNVRCRQIVTQPSAFDIECAYQQVENLGVDRWVAVLGARKLTDLPSAVLDFGTANTCDLVAGNQHVGGWIAPGYSLMRDSLVKNTQNVFADARECSQLVLGDSTESCVSSGCMAAQLGLVSMAEHYLKQNFEEFRIFVTGGLARDVAKSTHINVEFVENLVLIGLSRFI